MSVNTGDLEDKLREFIKREVASDEQPLDAGQISNLAAATENFIQHWIIEDRRCRRLGTPAVG